MRVKRKKEKEEGKKQTLRAQLSHFTYDEIKSQKMCPKLSRLMVPEPRLELPSLSSHLL